MTGAPLLEIQSLSLDYGIGGLAIHALRNVNLVARAGEAIGIVGESGCGKSTLASAIAGLLPPLARQTAGEMRFKGEELTPAHQRQLRGTEIAMIFQDPMTSFNPVLTIGSQLVDFQAGRGRNRRERREHAIATMAQVGIADARERFNSYPHELSGGMRQRAAIAAALSINPSLLIADEPTTALDVTMEAQIVHLFRELRRDYGGAILIVTHHLGVVAELCDRVYVMYAGEVVEDGSVDRIFHEARHPYTRALLSCDPANIEGTVDELPVILGQIPNLSHLPRGCVFAPRCNRKIELCESEGPYPVSIAEDHRALCRRALL